MKAVKGILGALGGVFALLCIFVMVCAFRPELTDKIAAVFNGADSGKTEGELPGGFTGNLSVSGGDAEEAFAPIEAGYDKDGVREPDADEKHYLLPAPEQNIPQNVAGKNGYIPVAEDGQGISQVPGAKDYGQTGEKITFDETFYPYYHMLSEALQRVYRQVYANAAVLNPAFTPLECLTAQQIQNVMEAVYNDHPELFWLDTAYSCIYTPGGRCAELTLQFNRTADRLEDNRRVFTAKTNEILAGAVNYTTDFEKERYVHDALLGRVEYVLDSQQHQSAYSALVNRKTVCAGYARAFQYVLQQLGIPCYYCTGYAGENHAWNIVRLGGRYYNVDVTWDDTTPETYAYFNRTDEDLMQDHTRRSLSLYLPVCDGTKYREETGKENPNEWQNTTGNFTDISGGDSRPESGKTDEQPGDGASYDGRLLTGLQEYYDNCYSQLSKGGKGTVKFQNVVDGKVLEAIYEAYRKEEYKKGFIEQLKKDWKAETVEVSIQVTGLEKEGEYLLTHTVVSE